MALAAAVGRHNTHPCGHGQGCAMGIEAHERLSTHKKIGFLRACDHGLEVVGPQGVLRQFLVENKAHHDIGVVPQ